MWYPLYFHTAVLMFVMTMKSVESHVTDTSFDMVGPGQSIMGKVGSERSVRRNIECSSMCLSDDSCHGYRYTDQRAGMGKCILIHKDGEETFQSDGSAVTYKKGWTRPSAALYYSFDSSDGLVLMEGTEQKNHAPLVSGKVNNALTLDRTKSQWIDLGTHTEACMTRPETCGTAGGTISLWVKVIDCSLDGIISSYSSSGAPTASLIGCYDTYIPYFVYLLDGYFHASHTRPTGWTHIVLNYIGPNDGGGIKMFYDGQEVKSGTSKSTYPSSAGDGRIVVGRYYTDNNGFYSSVEVDELIYFDAALTSDDVQSIYNSA